MEYLCVGKFFTIHFTINLKKFKKILTLESKLDIIKKMEINRIYNENCIDTMMNMPDEFIDLVVTSPPYDHLRKYKEGVGENWNQSIWQHIIYLLHKKIKQGGTCIWIVGDETVNGSETGTSFKQALYAIECGFNLETMIYEKAHISFPSKDRYYQSFEYMFVWTKGKPKTRNLIKDRKNEWSSRWSKKGTERKIDGEIINRYRPVNYEDFGVRTNIWRYHSNAGNVNPEWDIIGKHPAVMPQDIARDHIISWSNENDLVYDPFGGSGTTAKMAHELKRNWIMSEISADYCKIAEKRLKQYTDIPHLF